MLVCVTKQDIIMKIRMSYNVVSQNSMAWHGMAGQGMAWHGRARQKMHKTSAYLRMKLYTFSVVVFSFMDPVCLPVIDKITSLNKYKENNRIKN